MECGGLHAGCVAIFYMKIVKRAAILKTLKDKTNEVARVTMDLQILKIFNLF